MTGVLFVCHGNICRSPMAEAIFRELLAARGLSDAYFAASRAVSREELGHPVYPPAARVLRAHGLNARGKYAELFTPADYARFAHILAMDAGNLRALARMTGGDPQGKCRLLLACAGEARDIADPWFTGDFEAAYRDIERGCRALLTGLTAGARAEK